MNSDHLISYLKLLISIKYVNKAAKPFMKECFIPGGFPMCFTFLFYFFHMIHISQTHNPDGDRGALLLAKSLAFGLSRVTQKRGRHSSIQPDFIVQFTKTSDLQNLTDKV